MKQSSIRDVLLRILFLGATLIAGSLPGLSAAEEDASGGRAAKDELIAESRRYGVYRNVLVARSLLSNYEKLLNACERYGSPPEELSKLNAMRGDILYHAISAYFFAGDIEYPQEDYRLEERLNSLAPIELDHLQYPGDLGVLTRTGLLPSLPRSPYATGSILIEAPVNPQAGDLLYRPIPVFENFLSLVPGSFEGSLLVVFDTDRPDNEAVLDVGAIEGKFMGDLRAVLDYEKYNTVCFLWGSNPDTWE